MRRLPVDLGLRDDVTAGHLKDMGDLQDAVRTGLPPLGRGATNQWVFAAKLLARKRPALFPVRDAKVCIYLTGGKPLGRKAGRLGWFSRDIQVFAYLIAHPQVRERLTEARRQFTTSHPGWPIDHHDLRLLDVVLWMHAIR